VSGHIVEGRVLYPTGQGSRSPLEEEVGINLQFKQRNYVQAAAKKTKNERIKG
jgi:hypothetical protein